MTKVFVVEAGSYEDVYIVGLYTNQDNARAVARTTDDDNARVTEYDLDPPLTEEQLGKLTPGESMYVVSMVDDEVYASESFEEEGAAWLQSTPRDRQRVFVRCYVVAPSEEQAIKVANERKDAWLAAGAPLKGTPDYYGWDTAEEPT